MRKLKQASTILGILAGSIACTTATAHTTPAKTQSTTTTATISHSCSSMKQTKNNVRCFGIAKKGQNDCGTRAHSCAGMAKTSDNPQEWIFVLKGNCKRIAGGELQAPPQKT